MKRIFLFLATNLAIMLVLGLVLNIVFSILGIDSRSIGGLLVLAAVFGFGGAFLSLVLSRWIAKRSTGAEVITRASNDTEQWLLDTVERLSKAVGIKTPEVAIFPSPDMNAFATGMRRDASLVAVSSGLLNEMNQAEAEAVLAHEIAHIANGDMVTLTLIQGVVNTFVIFLAKILAGIVDNFLNGDEESSGHSMSYFMFDMLFQVVFGILASTIVLWFSRQREYKADEGSAKLVGKAKMIAALEKLQSSVEPQLEGSMAAFAINSGSSRSELFLSHPPLSKRIEALKALSL